LDTLKAGSILGRYQIKRLIGQGGMGCVYEAEHRDLKKRVAIKTLLSPLASNRDARERFLREGEAASRIRHAHVVDVTDVGSEGPVIYLVMEYLEGEDLARYIARRGFLSPTQAADIMLPVADAIATAHEQGVIHRDLKPENIFLVRAGHSGLHPKVLDFGISKVLGDSQSRALTGSAATLGTMNYMPPEQLHAARAADARSDQYGLGTILYECVTGQRAFEEETFYAVLKKIAEGQFRRPSILRPGLPPRLEAIILRAMSLNPAARFDSVRDLGIALLDFASEGSRRPWTSSFGAEQAVPEGFRADDAVRVATLVASTPVGSAGATRDLPSPLRSASTTMRSATGESEPRPVPSRSLRSRAPLVIGGIALVAAAGALIALVGVRSNRLRPEAPSSAASEEPAIAPLPAAPRVRAIVPDPPAPAPTPAPAPAMPTAPGEAPAAPGRANQAAPEVDSARAGTRPIRKLRSNPRRGAKASPRGGRSAEDPASPTPANDELIID
jgi:serine/threonine-protein kinase